MENKNIKYLVHVLKEKENSLLLHIGFVGADCPICTQYYDGTNGLKQMPKVFNTKELANEAILKAQSDDIAFSQENRIYFIIPIEVQ